VGQGQGDVGTVLQTGGVEPGARSGRRGRGQHVPRVDVSLEELADILGEELQLPRIQPKGRDRIVAAEDPLHGSTPPAPSRCVTSSALTSKPCAGRSRWHLQPGPAADRSHPRGPSLPQLEDAAPPREQRVIIYMMDVSGSMGDEQKGDRAGRVLLDRYLATLAVQGLACRLHHPRRGWRARSIARPSSTPRERRHDDQARPTGLCHELITSDYPSPPGTFYPFHFSDGDNWSADDHAPCASKILRDDLLPVSESFC